jgi:hypothetical protein
MSGNLIAVARPARVTAGDGARVGAAIGMLALAAALPLGPAVTAAWWVPAAIPAGAAAGAWAGPRVATTGPIRLGLVAASALIATVVGDAAICLFLQLGSASARAGGALGVLGSAGATIVVGLITVGWLAMLVLLPVAAAAIAIVRARAGRPPLEPRPRRGAWVGGLVVGLASGVLALTFPIVGYEIAALFVAGALLGRRTIAAIGGASFGAGAGWLALLANGALRCDPGSCIPPNLTPWLAVGLVMVAVGVALSVVAAVRS